VDLSALLRILLTDQVERAKQYGAQVGALAEDETRASHRDRCVTDIERALKACRALLDDPRLGTGLHGEMQLRQLQVEARRLGSVAFLLPILERFNDHDAILTALARRIAAEGTIALEQPLVTSANVGYYGASPDLALVVAPSLSRIVAIEIPDLVHELLHLFWHGREGDSAELLRIALRYFRQAGENALREDRPPRQREAIEFGRLSWVENTGEPWLLELACDAGASFVCGPAYAWQNLRLCAAASEPIYGYGAFQRASHPPAAARMMVMLSVVHGLELTSDADALGAAWNTLLTGLGAAKPDYYDEYCPHELADEVARRVGDLCADAGVRAFSRQESRGVCGPIVQICDEAWRLFISDPESYPEWEARVDERLRLELSAGTP